MNAVILAILLTCATISFSCLVVDTVADFFLRRKLNSLMDEIDKAIDEFYKKGGKKNG